MIAVGRWVYAIGALALGVVEWTYGAFASVWLPVPSSIPGYHLWAHASAALLIAAGAAILMRRTAAIGALVIAAFFLLTMLMLHLPPALARPMVWGVWQAVAESVAMAMGAVFAWSLTTGVGETRAASIARVARIAFGVCLLVFGVSHFAYARFTAAMTPGWLPPSQLFWAYATGVFQIAAGLAVLSGVQARLAAILLTLMYVLFGLLVHLPSLAKPGIDTWSENAINLLLVGAAWCLADTLSRGRPRSI